MIKIPKKISEKKIKNFFKKRGLFQLIEHQKLTKNNFKYVDRRRDSNPQPPDLRDLYNLYQFIVINNRTTVLEFGCGYSSLVMSMALKFNQKRFKGKKPFERCKFPYTLFSVDNQKKYINIAKKRIKKILGKNNNANFFYSSAHMTLFNNNFAVEYKKLPNVNPDFIYLDGPNQWGVKGKVNNFTTSQEDMMPMSCDILKFENYLTPGTIIVADGRVSNSLFLKNNFKRNWYFKIDRNNDQCYFYLKDPYLGQHNKKQLIFYKKN